MMLKKNNSNNVTLLNMKQLDETDLINYLNNFKDKTSFFDWVTMGWVNTYWLTRLNRRIRHYDNLIEELYTLDAELYGIQHTLFADKCALKVKSAFEKVVSTLENNVPLPPYDEDDSTCYYVTKTVFEFVRSQRDKSFK